MSDGDKFRKELTDCLRGKGYDVSEAFCVKNNGGKDGIVFHDKSPFSPVFYTGELLEQHTGGRTIQETAQYLIGKLERTYRTGQIFHYLPSLEKRQDYQKIRRDVRLCMVQKSANRELLAETPHRDYGDFAAVAYWVTGESVEVRILLRQNVLDMLGTGFEMVFKDAYINMMGEFELKSMEEMLYETVAAQLRAEQMKEVPADRYIHRMCQGTELYLLTHKTGRFGSAAMCYQREMERAAGRAGGDFVIIPSSIHELLLLPVRRNIPLEAVSELVRRINAGQADQEECLSDTIYIYSQKEKRILAEREYLQKIQTGQMNGQYRKSERAAGEEWEAERCLM